jgi:polyisoprenoid-binding protein YceI
MKKIKIITASAVLLLTAAFTFIKPVSWKVKGSYSVKISCGLGAEFKVFTAGIVFDEEHPEKSVITATVDATSIETGKDLMNMHARDKEGLYTDRYSLITFVSTAVSKTADGYMATGKLTLKGITKEVKIPFYFSSQKASDKFPFIDRETFSGKFYIKPRDFNITRQGVPNELCIELNIPVIRE